MLKHKFAVLICILATLTGANAFSQGTTETRPGTAVFCLALSRPESAVPKPSVWTSLVQTGDSLRVEQPSLTATPAHMPVPERLTLGGVARDWLRDAAQIWSSPFQGKSHDLLPFCVMALTAAVLIPNDERVNHVLTDVVVDQDRDDAISPLVSQMGSYGAWGAVGAFFGFGLLAKDHKAVETASLAASAMLQSELVVGLAKMATGRQRPSAGNGVDSCFIGLGE